MSGAATKRVVRSIVAPAIGVSAGTLAAASAVLLLACAKEADSAGGGYTGPVGMVPAHVADAATPPPPGIVPVQPIPPGLVTPPTVTPPPPTGMPTGAVPNPAGSGLMPQGAAGRLLAATETPRPTRPTRRATDADARARFDAFGGAWSRV